MNPQTLYIIFDKKDLERNLDKKINVFTLNEFILTDIEKEKVHHIFPDPIKTSLNAESLSLKTQKFKLEIISKIKKNNFFRKLNNIDELLDPFLEMKISSHLYLKSTIPNYQNYILIINKKEFFFKDKSDLLCEIEKYYSRKLNNNSVLDKFKISNLNFLNENLLIIQNKLLKKFFKLNKKELIFLSDQKVYFLDYLKSKLKNKSNLFLYYSPTISYLKIILLLFKQFYALIRKKNLNELGIFLLPNNYINKSFLKLIKNIKRIRIKELDDKFANLLLEDSYLNIIYSISYEKYLLKIFKGIKIKNSYFHSLRFSDLLAFSLVLSKYKNNIFLISHGSHTVQKNSKLDFLASKSLGIGMTYTNQKGIKILSQSKYCDDFLDYLKVNYLRCNRILKQDFLSNTKETKNSKITRILYVGTIKQLGARRYYVESSAEFFGSVNYIYKKLLRYKKDFKIIIRIRDVPFEINNEILNNAFRYKKDLIELGGKKSIYEEIKDCDCLISLSSTTLEEGIEMNKPVMSFGLSNYNHLSCYEKIKNNPKDYVSNKNLKIIEDSLGRKFISKSNLNRNLDYKV